jgi:hypothetical protein
MFLARLVAAIGAVTVLGGASSVLTPSVKPKPLIEVVRESDLIVVAKVDVIKPEDPPRKDWKDGNSDDVKWIVAHGRRAHAKVIEKWKGDDAKECEFLADKTWTCDSSSAEIGETVVLFLTKAQDKLPRQIAFDGYGRMPIRNVDRTDYATIEKHVILPKETKLMPGPEPSNLPVRGLALEALKQLVEDSVKELDKDAKKKSGE